MKLGVALFLMLFSAMSAEAQEYLEPERSVLGGDSVMTDYDSLIVSTLKEAYDANVVARMVVVPSFSAEFAIGLRGEPGHYRIFVLRPSVQLWGYISLGMLKSGKVEFLVGDAKKGIAELEAKLPANPRDVTVKSCHTDIDPALGDRVVSVWETMLRMTRFPKEDRMGLDGVEFHFSGGRKMYGLAGQIWSPDQDSNTDLLAQIGTSLGEVCEKKDNASLAELSRVTTRLYDRLH